MYNVGILAFKWRCIAKRRESSIVFLYPDQLAILQHYELACVHACVFYDYVCFSVCVFLCMCVAHIQDIQE